MDSRWRSVAKRLCFDLSKNKCLRTLETTALSIEHAGDAAPEFLAHVLSSVASPGLLEVVVIYRDCDFNGNKYCSTCTPDPVCHRHSLRSPPLKHFPSQLRVVREMHNVHKFLLVFCVDVYGCAGDICVSLLKSAVKTEEENGGFEYLGCRPVITCEGRTIRTRQRDHHVGTAPPFVLASAL